MDKTFFTNVCLRCPHARLVGGEPPNWRVKLCCYAVDHAEPKKRAGTPVVPLDDMLECPDEPRRVRAAGGA